MTLPTTLDQWLAHCEQLHPKTIDMTLERVKLLCERLDLRFDVPVVAVAGTNGKGSSCAMLEAVALQAGYRVGLYIKPHLVRFNERCRINGQFASVYPGVPEGLQALRDAGLRLACLTNKPLPFALALLRAKGLDGFFAHIFGGDSFEKKKPDPLPLLKTCQALGTLPACTLMVGDSSNDAQAARAAGCPVVLTTYGYNHGQPVRSVDADGWIDSLAELL